MDEPALSPPEAAPATPLTRSIVLVGLMGAGKSTIGRKLAQAMGMPFADADTEIEKAAGLPVSEIFAKYGEAHFRDGERRVIRRLLEGPPHVLATGGGAFMHPETRAVIADCGISVWIRAELNVLMKRVLKRQTRPLLAQGDPEETMRQLMIERYPVYAEADITVDSHDGPQDDVVRAILEALTRWGAT